METFLPFIYHLKEIACHYKKTGSIPAKALEAREILKKCDTPSENPLDKIPKTDGRKNQRTSSSKGHGSKEPFKPVVCCGIIFKYPSHLKVHQKSFKHLHTIDPIKYKIQKRGFQPVKCCGVVFKHPVHWKDHTRTMNHLQRIKTGTLVYEGDIHQQINEYPRSAKTFTCEVCNLTFKYWQQLQVHKRVKHENFTGYQCSACSFICDTEEKLRSHFEKEHLDSSFKPLVQHDPIGPVMCCGSTFRYQSHLDRHKKSLTHQNKFTCRLDKCNQRFDTVEEWKHHRATIHFNVDGKFQCLICENMYASFPILQTHIKEVHSKSTIYECSQCATTCASKWGLSRHFRTHHLTKRAEFFICDVCELKFKRKSALASHRRVHQNGKLFCPRCRVVFQTRESYEEHQLAHRPCQVCGMTFQSTRQRESHMKSHLTAINAKKQREHSKQIKRIRACVKKEKEISALNEKDYRNDWSYDKFQDVKRYSDSKFKISENCESLRKFQDDKNCSVIDLKNENFLCSNENNENIESSNKVQDGNDFLDSYFEIHENTNSQVRESLKELPVYFNL